MNVHQPQIRPPTTDSDWANGTLELSSVNIEPISGTVLRDGLPVQEAALWRNGTMYRGGMCDIREPTQTLRGRHVWAGILFHHFGHFVTESVSRLWAVDNSFDSLIFVPKDMGRPVFYRLAGYQQELLTRFGITCPITIVTEPTRVETLVVPGQGFGLGDISLGTSRFRSFVRKAGQDVAPAGERKIYLSRSGLPKKTGSFVGETAVERSLAQEGYRIYHPERESITDQLAQYKAATHILGADGSAFHLAGFVAQPAQKVGVILRRSAADYKNIVNQMTGMGVTTEVLDHVRANWLRPGKAKPDDRSYGELDSATLAQDLADRGFIDRPTDWLAPDPEDVEAELVEVGQAHKGVMSRRPA
ncbi:glycosyltransferase family 61 protein [Falsirhodobacter sp. 20TX0035]|uniref:glycosyltransferase family 61 protein n=1 Tax=Falsirhodobacter sp. 20TX0035 TaxID=3022019 RepID=UPI00232B51FC|nr:glycosyltransferase 61 family protein [Falsirhodobacter sp. 20TX0035]MDB6455121.1 glycosyltransferase 61 family protein [Falsirhodobacter sp. 20TX0035]